MARLLVLEWHREASEIADYTAMLQEETEWDCFFVWSDGCVKPFGLLDEDGAEKPEYAAFQDAQEEDPMAEPNDDITATMKTFEEAGGAVGQVYLVTDTPEGGQIVNTDAGLFVSQPGVPGAQILLDARVANPFRATRA